MKNFTAFWFYLGTLISSIGSFTFNICLIAFMVRAGYDLAQVSLILGLQRMVPIFISTFLGHRTDELPPRLTVVVSELGAALASFGILWAWSAGTSAYLGLLGFTVLKTSIVSFQVGSRAKLTKLLADATYESNASHAIWFNKATQGATLFAGLCAWPIIKYLNFETAIWIDLITFMANGVIVYFLQFRDEQASTSQTAAHAVFSKFKQFYGHNPRAAMLDALLAVSMMGTTSFTARIAGDDQKWVAILIGSYGLSVWFSGYLERSKSLAGYSRQFWAGLGASYALLGVFPGSGILTLILALSKDTFYWLLFHRISSHIQMDTPQPIMGSVSSARSTQMVMILASGELLVGGWSKVLPVVYDGLWRAIFCLVVMAVLALPRFQAEEKYGYAKL